MPNSELGKCFVVNRRVTVEGIGVSFIISWLKSPSSVGVILYYFRSTMGIIVCQWRYNLRAEQATNQAASNDDKETKAELILLTKSFTKWIMKCFVYVQ